ncbi:MAG: Ig-like domain-containing protein [Bacteroidota bacterium]
MGSIKIIRYLKYKMAWAKALAIFCVIGFSACTSINKNEAPVEISFEFDGDRPIAVRIPSSFFPEQSIDTEQLSLSLSGTDQPILGNIKLLDGVVEFMPAIPFKRSLSYEVNYEGKRIDEFKIPEGSAFSSPKLVKIYPTLDTVPENLLKIHLVFSEKMSELHSSNYVSLLNAQGDTLNHIFLKLDPELWNYDQTVLTLWLEPGRIKKSLLPNILDGIPIEEGNQYSIAVSYKWKSAKGVPLKESVIKTFYVGRRDEVMPHISTWEIQAPKSSSLDPLILNFNEALDYTSLLGSFLIMKEDQEIAGRYSVEETRIQFIPESNWTTGNYTIKIDGSIEDLAANNLNRLFDRDLLKDSTEIVASNKVLRFEVTDALQL